MNTLSGMLQDSDAGLIHALAAVWGVRIDNLSSDEALEALTQAMLEPENIESIWNKLDDQARAALQLLISSSNKMQGNMFERAYGKIRKMGRGQIEREQPYLRPQSPAEALYYRGFIAEGFDKTAQGLQPVVYIPIDLLPLLPTHITSYDDLESDEDYEDMLPEVFPIEEDELHGKQTADTSIVDDMTTLLAYLRNHTGMIENNTLSQADQDALIPYMLKDDPNRLAFLLAVGVSADLIIAQDGKVYPNRSGIPNWLAASRSLQLKQLVEAWATSQIYVDLWHVPGLFSEGEWAYDPVHARTEFLGFVRDYVPIQHWWAVDELIETIKEQHPDFQRSDYDSWYIRNEHGEYLKGFESWDAVEGTLLEFYFDGPLHWLGLIDLAEDATVVHLNAYGRAFIAGEKWLQPPESEEKIQIEPNGVMFASRKVSRMDRFQVARFSTWGDPNPDAPYQYILDADGIQQAAEQGITTEHIAAFIKRQMNNEPIPKAIARLLEAWQAGSSSSVTFEPLLVLRTTAIETMDFIHNEPAFRRYLGARLGPTACIIRAEDGGADLKAALEAQSIEVEVLG